MLGRSIAAAIVAVALVGSVAAQDVGSRLTATTQTPTRYAQAAAPAFFLVQVGAGRTEDHARRALQELRETYPEILGRLPIRVERADLSSKGIWYRMQLGVFRSSVEAERLCRELARAGHPDCLVIQRHVLPNGKQARPRDHEARVAQTPQMA